MDQTPARARVHPPAAAPSYDERLDDRLPFTVACGTGSFAVLPRGFPFPVPRGVVLTCTLGGIVVDAGVRRAEYHWSEVAEVEATALGSIPFVAFALTNGEKVQLDVPLDAQRFGVLAHGRLAAWEGTLSAEVALERARLKGRLAELEAAKRRKLAAARRLPIGSKERASADVVLVSGEVKRNGYVALLEDVIEISDIIDRKWRCLIPWLCIGDLTERITETGTELVAVCTGLSDVTEVIFRPSTDRWLELYATFFAFSREHDLRGIL